MLSLIRHVEGRCVQRGTAEWGEVDWPGALVDKKKPGSFVGQKTG